MALRTQIETASSGPTQSERELASALPSDRSSAGLISIKEPVERFKVSPPLIARFSANIGLSGYSEMQKWFLTELLAGDRSPADIHAASRRMEGGYPEGFPERAAPQMKSAGEVVSEGQFDCICELLPDPKRSVFAIGGSSKCSAGAGCVDSRQMVVSGLAPRS